MALEIAAPSPLCSLSSRKFTILLLWLASPIHAVYRSHGDTADDADAVALQLKSECKITGKTSKDVIEQLRECTDVLHQKLEETKTQRKSSTEANAEYFAQFK